MSLQWRGQRIKPVNVSDEEFERPAGKDVFDAHRQNGDAMIYRPLDLSANLRRGIRVCCENEHHHPASFNGVDDGLAPFHAGQDVSGSNPTPDSIRLQHGAHCVSSDLVFRGMANEDVVSHSSDQLVFEGETASDTITRRVRGIVNAGG